MHIIKFGTSPGDFIGPFAFRSEAEQYASDLSCGSALPYEVIPLRAPCFTLTVAGPATLAAINRERSNIMRRHLHAQILADKV